MKKNRKVEGLKIDDSVKQNLYNLYILYLSKSYKEEHDKELKDYLKSLIKEVNKPKNKYSLNKNNQKTQIYFDFSFAETLFKNNKSSMALLYCLKKQYYKSISYAVKCPQKNISIFIANSIPDSKKKKEIWLSLFNYYKSEGIQIIEDILKESKGILTITDILPHLMGNVQLKDIETNLNKYIDEYEIKLRKLKRDIKEFAKSEEILDKKISKFNGYGKKKLKIKLEEINEDEERINQIILIQIKSKQNIRDDLYNHYKYYETQKSNLIQLLNNDNDMSNSYNNSKKAYYTFLNDNKYIISILKYKKILSNYKIQYSYFLIKLGEGIKIFLKNNLLNFEIINDIAKNKYDLEHFLSIKNLENNNYDIIVSKCVKLLFLYEKVVDKILQKNFFYLNNVKYLDDFKKATLKRKNKVKHKNAKERRILIKQKKKL